MTETQEIGQTDTSSYPVPTIIEFLLDETGSMNQHLEATIGGYNDFLDEQRQGSGTCLMSFTKFDSKGLRTPYVDIDVNMVPNLNRQTFIPGEMTNLRDALVARIENLQERLSHWDIVPRVLFVAMTDGGDNCSSATTSQVKSKILEVSSMGWTCVYLGANQNANKVGIDLGFLSQNIKSFETARMRETMQELARATTAFRVNATGDFFAQQSV